MALWTDQFSGRFPRHTVKRSRIPGEYAERIIQVAQLSMLYDTGRRPAAQR
ncbi:MAG: hypothetical protein AMXMBFR83_08410 [Phycisphaerae bacterium]